jgi:raffinose/stachyose/melibiose transport system substrate-binding protein
LCLLHKDRAAENKTFSFSLLQEFIQMKKLLSLALLLVFVLGLGLVSAQEPVTLVIESWRNDDLSIWNDVLIPAFEAQHPEINVEFQPAAPTEYNAALNAKLEGGTAGDLITCRPFDQSLQLYDAGYLADLTDLPGMENFSDVAKSAWITDDGSAVFCVPMASVIHGFLYNKAIFDELGLEEPTTEEEFLAVLQAVKDAGGYEPLAMGTVDQWESATMGYQNIGPNYWHGEEGRLGLIDGTAKYNEGGFLAAFEALSRWQPYLPSGYQAVTYPDAQNLFMFGQAAVYPAGSWDISVFNPQVDFEMGAFKPPVPEGSDTCYISDHTDIAMGMNAASEHAEEARIFLEWMASAEFAQLYSNALPGFYSLSNHEFTVDDPLAQEFLSWRGECESTIRSSYQILSRGEPNNEQDLWAQSALLLNGEVTAQEAADTVQAGLEAWYEPQMP